MIKECINCLPYFYSGEEVTRWDAHDAETCVPALPKASQVLELQRQRRPRIFAVKGLGNQDAASMVSLGVFGPEGLGTLGGLRIRREVDEFGSDDW
jgi:hypothetical protein